MHFSPREQKVIRCLARGLSDKRTAAELGLAYDSAKRYASALYAKLGLTKYQVNNRAFIGIYAERLLAGEDVAVLVREMDGRLCA